MNILHSTESINRQNLTAAKTKFFTKRNARILSILIVVCIFSSAQAQNNNVRNEAMRLANDTADARIEAKLVELALKGPMFIGSIHQNKITEYQLRGAKNAWLNLLTLSTNYNDQSFTQTNQTIVYPKYFFGLTIPLGTLLSRTEVKAATEQVQISKINQEQLRRNITADIIGKWKQYKSMSALIALENEMLSDVDAALLQSEEKFRNGTITIEAYNASQRSKSDELAKLINLRLQQDLLKLEIEKMIGTPLETVVKK